MKNVGRILLPLPPPPCCCIVGFRPVTTYVSLRLTSIHVSSVLIGAIIAANYIGLVIGGKSANFPSPASGISAPTWPAPASSPPRCWGTA